MPHFNPKRVLRQVSRSLLREFFAAQDQPRAVAWDAVPEVPVEEIFRAVQGLPEEARERIEIALQDVDALATEDGVRVLVEEGRWRGLDVRKDLEAMESRHDMALWAHLRFPEIWDAAVLFGRSDGLPARSWTRRGDVPKVEPLLGREHLSELEAALSDFYREREGRGHHCLVEHLPRGGRVDHFFVYLSDYADTYINFDDRGKLQRASERRAFEVVFAFDREAGTLAMFARGGRKLAEPLQRIFCRVVLGQELPSADPDSKAYVLDPLMDRDTQFPTDPEDGIEGVSILRMQLSVVGNRRRRIELAPDPEGGPSAIYDMLDHDLNRERLHPSILRLTKVTLQFQFKGNGHGPRPPLTFDVAYPHSCNLKSRREPDRVLGEKYLRRFGIDVC